MKYKTKKIVKIIPVMILIFALLGTNVQAFGTISNMVNTAKNFGSGNGSAIFSGNAVQNFFYAAYGFILTLAIIVAVIMGMLLAVKIITGSVDERADAKGMIYQYLINVLWIALVPTIYRIILEIIY